MTFVLFYYILYFPAYHPGLWTAWSSCSASCGQVRFNQAIVIWWFQCRVTCSFYLLCYQGVRSKTRECFNTLTLKQTERKNCANEEKYFKQTQACKSRECPGWIYVESYQVNRSTILVDGGWSNWENWSVCDQVSIT